MGINLNKELVAEARRANDYVSPLAIAESEHQVDAYQQTIDRIAMRLGMATANTAIREETVTELQQMIKGISQTVFRNGFEAGRDYEQGGDS
jgi:hypothetical protein